MTEGISMTAAGIPALLEPIQARLDAATPGPWESKGIANGRSDLFANGDYYGGKKSVATAADSEFGACSDNDAEFIAHAPTDITLLLAAVKAVLEVSEEPDVTLRHPKGDKTFYVEAHRIRSAVKAALRGEA